MTQQRAEQEAAYVATSYFVDAPGGRFAIRVGAASPGADALTVAHGVSTWVYVTAYNPGSAPAPAEQNRGRQRELEEVVRGMGLPFYQGEGGGDDGAWPAEPSLLILGIAEADALRLARRYGQAAFVFGERGMPARLAWADPPGEK